MSDDVIKRITEHDKEIARQGAAIVSMERSIATLADSVNGALKSSEMNFARVFEKIDEQSNITRPDVKWAVGGIGSLLIIIMSAFTIVLNLTVEPMRETMMEFSKDQAEHIKEYNELTRVLSGEIEKGEGLHERNDTKLRDLESHMDKWNTYQGEYINKLREESRIHGQEIKGLTEDFKWMKQWVQDVDSGGSRKWIKQKNNKDKE